MLEKQRAETTEPDQSLDTCVGKPTGVCLLKNLSVAAALVVCAVALRSGALPAMTDATDAVMTALTSDSLLDDRLGRLSFVSTIFPEATLVFGESKQADLYAPVDAEVVHAWSESEPYTAWRSTASLPVSAAFDGEVTELSRLADGSIGVWVRGTDGLVGKYGGIQSTQLREGDAVRGGDIIGTLAKGSDMVLEVRRDGYSIDPGSFPKAAP